MGNYFKNLNKGNYILIALILLFFFITFPNILFCLFNFLEIYSNAVLAIIAIFGLFFGQSWLNTSKDKMKGKLEHDIARKYLKTILKIRDTIKIVRAPFILSGEIQNALKKNGLPAEDYEDKEKVNRSVYSLRWAKVQEEWSVLDEILLDAEVSWGSEAINIQKELDNLVRQLRSVIWLYVESSKDIKVEDREILYGTHDENDNFAKKINIEIEKIKEFLKKYL